MNRILFILVLILHSSFCFANDTESQKNTAVDSCLRLEVQKQIEKAEELINISSDSSINSAQHALDSLLNIINKNFNHKDTLLVKTLNTLARCRLFRADYDSAIQLALKALDISEITQISNHLMPLYSYEILIECCLNMHDLVKCEHYCDLRFEILNSLDQPLTTQEAEQMVDALNDRARLLVLQNKYIEAVNDLERGLDFITNEMKRGPRLRVDLNGNIAWILAQQGKSEESEKRLQKVLEMAKSAYNPNHPIVLYTIHLLGMCARQQSHYHQADSIMNLEIALCEKIHGRSSPMLSDIYQSKAFLLIAQDKPDEALDIAMNAVNVNRNLTGDYPTNKLMGSLETAGNIAMTAGKWSLASDIFNELLSHKHSFLNTVFGYASEKQKLSYLSKYPPIINTLLSGLIISSSQELKETAMNMILHGKCMALDAIAEEHALAICSIDPFLDSLLSEHRKVCSKIAGYFLSSLSQEEITKLLPDLYERKNAIEKELSHSCYGLNMSSNHAQISAGDVATKLDKRTALWEFIKFNKTEISDLYNSQAIPTETYMVMILTSDSNISVVDLGKASTIDSLIEKFHDTMSATLYDHLSNNIPELNEKIIEVSNKLYSRLVSPIIASSVDVDKIFVVPDGMLNLLPFETLSQNGERYLIEDHQFIYLTSGRDLLKNKIDLSDRSAIVIAAPDYMIDPQALPTLVSSGSSVMPASRGNSDTPECLASMFSPLPKAREEGVFVTHLLKQTGHYDITYLEYDQAREGYLKTLSDSPSVLHIATHGYYCEQAGNSLLSNPLLRSGLLLAGANRTIGKIDESNEGGEDGILTAMEVSGLNLVGTDLVVLSACQTGIGDVKNGEGVFGLKRAFQYAGAKSVIMSMFSAPDESTSILIQRFYTNWLSGQSKSSALRNASLEILAERRRNKLSTYPVYWGGFIIVGDPD